MRREDPAVVAGASLPALLGTNLAALALMSARNGVLAPVPFQIDRKDAEGRPLLEWVRARVRDPWARNPGLAAHPALEEQDEAVFLARDLGARVPRARCPVDGARAWAYLLAFPAAPPACATDYISFDPRQCLVRSADLCYGRRDPDHPAVFNYLALGDAPDAPNLLERFRLQVDASTFFDRMHIRRDENDVQTRLLGYTDGPVRVLVRQLSTLELLAWIHSEWVDRLTVNYPGRIEIPTTARVPFRPGRILSAASIEAKLALTDAVAGARLVHPALSGPRNVSREMTPVTDTASSNRPQWCALSGSWGGLVAVLHDDPRLLAAGLPRQFDFRGLPCGGAPEENPPGAYAQLEMRASGMEKMGAGTYHFSFVIYGRRDFQPGDEQQLLRIDAQPLEISTGAGP